MIVLFKHLHYPHRCFIVTSLWCIGLVRSYLSPLHLWLQPPHIPAGCVQAFFRQIIKILLAAWSGQMAHGPSGSHRDGFRTPFAQVPYGAFLMCWGRLSSWVKMDLLCLIVYKTVTLHNFRQSSSFFTFS